jgi:hypothetical protein
LPDGRVAETLDRYELAHALIAIGVEGVTVNTPKFESLQTYRAHLEDIKNEAVKAYSHQGSANEFAGSIKGDAA